MPEIEDHPGAGPRERRRRTALLIGLLDDDSPVVVSEVRGELARIGRAGAGALLRASRTGSPRVRVRARQLLLEQARRRAVRRLVRYAAREDGELERALLLLDAHGKPGEDLRSYRRALDAFADEVRSRLQRGARPAAALGEYLGGEVGFAGPRADYHHPDNVYLHRAIERRAGMPLTLCAIYAAVGRRAGIDAVGLLPVPGHVLLAVGEGRGRRILDPFAGGLEVERQHVIGYLERHGIPRRPDFLLPASDDVLFDRHVNNLIHSCRRLGRRIEAEELELVSQVLRRRLAPPRRNWDDVSPFGGSRR